MSQVKQTVRTSTARGQGPEVQPDVEFLRANAGAIDHALFMMGYSNWRVSLAGASGIAWVLGAMFDYLEPAANTLWWAGLQTLVFVGIALVCIGWQRRRPVPESAEQRRWLLAWTLLTGAAGLVTGALLWFIPAGRDDLQLSAAAVTSILLIAFVVSRGHRPIIYAIVCAYALSLCLALGLHARLLAVTPLAAAFSGFVLFFGLKLNDSMRAAIGQRLYARHLYAQLQQSLPQQLQEQRTDATLRERRRVFADLNDSVAEQLLQSLEQLESGKLKAGDAVAVLRACSEDLRLMLDVHEPAARSPGVLLGMLRHRVRQRIEAAGLHLNWEVDRFPETDSLNAVQSLDLLRILQEAIDNVVQHAQAQHLLVQARRSARQLEIRVEDDGVGFDPSAMSNGRGIAAMQRRAGYLGAELQIDSSEGGGTAVRLILRVPLGG